MQLTSILIISFVLMVSPGWATVDETEPHLEEGQKRVVMEITMEQAIQARIQKKMNEEKKVTQGTPTEALVPPPPQAEPVFDEMIEEIEQDEW